MDTPGADSLMGMVRRINEIGRRARSGEPSAEDYLRLVSSDPTTEWFTDLLREKNDELQKEKERSEKLASALRAWHRVKSEGTSTIAADEAAMRLVEVLRETKIIER
jgi:hypothetical protein